MAATAPVARSRKPAYRPHIKIVDRARGLYTVSSRTYGGHVLYLVNVTAQTCECEGNAQWGKTCHHLKAATWWHRVSSPKPAVAPAPDGVALLLECFA